MAQGLKGTYSLLQNVLKVVYTEVTSHMPPFWNGHALSLHFQVEQILLFHRLLKYAGLGHVLMLTKNPDLIIGFLSLVLEVIYHYLWQSIVLSWLSGYKSCVDPNETWKWYSLVIMVSFCSALPKHYLSILKCGQYCVIVFLRFSDEVTFYMGHSLHCLASQGGYQRSY